MHVFFHQKKQSFKMCQEPSLLSLNGNAHLLPLYNAVCKAMKQYENTGCAEDGHYLLYEVHKRWYLGYNNCT